MLAGLPFYIPILFVLTTMATAVFFMAAVKKNNSNKTTVIVLIIIILSLLVHAILAINGFYLVTDTLPPRFALLIAPVFLLIILLFLTPAGRKFIDTLSLKILTRLHVVRIFVEIILWALCIYKFIPELMTFEGRNFDILSSITAPVVAYYGFTKRKLNNTFLIVWNVLCLLLLINIVANAILSAPFPFQQFAFDQPNIAVLYFPFVWLPCFIVPVVLFSHLVLIRRLMKKEIPN
jgi:hypothetical protein